MSGLGGIGLKNSQQDGLDSEPELQQLAAGCEQITLHSVGEVILYLNVI